MNLNFTELLRAPWLYFLLGTLLLGFTAFIAFDVSPNFDQRTIGITVLHGQDAAARNAIYVFSIFSGLCFLLALFLKLPAARDSSATEDESTHHGVILGIVIAANLLLLVTDSNPVFLRALYALAYLAVLGILINAREKKPDLRDFRWILAALAYHLLITAYCLAGESPRFDGVFFALLSLVLVALNLLYEKAPREYRDGAALASIARGLWPLMLLPMAIILANEAQYTLHTRLNVQLPGLALWLIAFLLVAIRGYRIYRAGGASVGRTDLGVGIGALMHGVLVSRYLPMIILTSVAFTEYSELMDYFRMRDFFHGGESLAPVQQLLQFGALPYVDFYPPHGLFDMLPQFFYQVLNQTPYPESVLWGEGYFLGWLPRMLAAAIAYGLLGRLLDFKTAFLVPFALPTYHVLHPYYSLLLIPAMLIGRTPKTLAQWLVFWGVIFGLVLWRIDFGIAAMAGAVFVVAAQSYSLRSLSMLGRAASAFVLVCLALATAFIVATLAKQHSPVQHAQQILNYIHIQTATTGLTRIVHQIDLAAALQYALLPLVAVSYLAYFVAHVVHGRDVTYAHRVLAFVAVSSLVISLRSLNRHSLYEGVFNPYFFTLVAALAPLFFHSLTRTTRTTLFVAVCVASFALFPRSTSLFYKAFYEGRVEKEYPAPASPRAPVALKQSAPDAGRLVSRYGGQDNIVYFLENFLQGNETFYDFANSPLLYALAGKKFPGFVLETLYHTSEVGQKALIADLQELARQGDLPVVLFKQNNGWDKTDGVDTAVRSYRVAEYIYRNFEPCVNIDHYEIWLARGLPRGEACIDYLKDRLSRAGPLPKALAASMRPARAEKQAFNLIKLPYVWANFDEYDAIGSSDSVQPLQAVPVSSDAGQAYRLPLPARLDKEDGNYVHLRIQSGHAGQVTLDYAGGNRLSFDVLPSPEPRDYLVRVSVQHAWFLDDVEHMDVVADFPFSISHAALLRGD